MTKSSSDDADLRQHVDRVGVGDQAGARRADHQAGEQQPRQRRHPQPVADEQHRHRRTEDDDEVEEEGNLVHWPSGRKNRPIARSMQSGLYSRRRSRPGHAACGTLRPLFRPCRKPAGPTSPCGAEGDVMRIHSQPRTRDRERRIFGLFLLVGGLVLAACVPLKPYHTGPTPAECGERPEGDCLTTFVEKYECKEHEDEGHEAPEYLLGFVEFDDLGWAWNREQGRVLFGEIRNVEKDVLMVLFVHGWKHDADSCDTNVTCFREALRGLHAAETALYGKDARQIVGVYVGWRGDSSKGRIPRQLSFFDRKATAHKVGSGSLTELIVRLKEERTMRGGDSRLVIVGHSFGGAAVFSATSQLLMDRLVTADERCGAVRGLGDLVVLVNPAFEAARYQPLHQTLNEETVGCEKDQNKETAQPAEKYQADQAPVFAIFTSKGDTATGKWFPRGRTLAARKDKHSSNLQKRANREAVGHFEEFRTHSLAPKGTPEPLPKVDDRNAEGCGCPYGSASLHSMSDPKAIRAAVKRLQDLRFQGARSMDFGDVVLQQDGGRDHSPIIVASVDNSIIKGHNDIYRPAFVDFLALVHHALGGADEGQAHPGTGRSVALSAPVWPGCPGGSRRGPLAQAVQVRYQSRCPGAAGM